MPPACCAGGASSIADKCGPKSEPPAWMARSSVDSIPDAWSIIKPGAVVLLRADLNVPLSPSSSAAEDGDGAAAPAVVVLDDARVVAAVPTILYLTHRGARVLLLTHVGRPKGGAKRDPGLTTDALVPVLEAALRKAATAGGEKAAVPVPPVTKIDDCVGPLVAAAARSCPDSGVVLLENVRFHAGEETNDPASSSLLSSTRAEAAASAAAADTAAPDVEAVFRAGPRFLLLPLGAGSSSSSSPLSSSPSSMSPSSRSSEGERDMSSSS